MVKGHTLLHLVVGIEANGSKGRWTGWDATPAQLARAMTACIGEKLMSGSLTFLTHVYYWVSNFMPLVSSPFHLTFAFPCAFPHTRRGQRCGHGKMSYGGGQTYVGNWAEGVRNGCGTFAFPDGTTFEGHFKQGLRHGTGTFRLPNGDAVDQLWENGKLVQHTGSA